MRSLIFHGLPSCLLIFVACGPVGGTSTGSTSEASSSTSGGPTGTSGTSGPTSGGSGVVTGTGTDTSTTGPDTTTTAGTITTTTSGSSTTDGPATSTSTGTSGGPVEGCVKDEDCKLHEDCCVCEGVPVDENPTDCDVQCKQSRCQELGIDAAVCRLGVCETERLSCDQNKVLCDSLPPNCEAGMLPETSPNCWTGRCVPAVFCDVIPDCSFCPDGKMCVQYTGEGIFPTVCEPIPPGCGGTPSCECAADLVCTGIFSFCSVKGDVIGCDCPNC